MPGCSCALVSSSPLLYKWILFTSSIKIQDLHGQTLGLIQFIQKKNKRKKKEKRGTFITQKIMTLPVSEGCDNQTASVSQVLIAIDKLSIDCSDVQVSPCPVVSNDE